MNLKPTSPPTGLQGARTTRSCIECRRRKKGCDFHTPACGRCRHLEITCRYEDRQWTFVPQHGDLIDRTSQLATLSRRSLASTDSALLRDAHFWKFYLPNEDSTLDGSIGGVLSAPWIPTVRALAEMHTDVKVALQACTFAGIGWEQNDRDLLQHGTQLYARALKATNEALRDPVRVRSDSVLACCRLLSLFEMFQRTSPSSATPQDQAQDWRSHVEGSCGILQLRGRARHESGHGLQLYDGVRMTAIIYGLSRRQPNSFTSLNWHLPQRTLRDELFELASGIPELLQQIDRLKAHMAHKADAEYVKQHRRELTQHGRTIGKDLREWEARALNMCRAQACTPEHDPCGADAPLLNNHLSLAEACTAHGDGFFFICTQYWAVCTILYSSIQLLHQQPRLIIDAFCSADQTPQTLNWADPEPLALNIAHVAAHFFRPQAGLWSAQSAVFPVGTALSYFSRTGRRESAPFAEITKAIASSKNGIIMRGFLHSMLGLQHKRE